MSVELGMKGLRERLAEIDRERAQILFTMSVLQRIDGQPLPAMSATRQWAICAVESLGRPVRAPQVVREMRRMGWQTGVSNVPASVCAALSRAAKEGSIAHIGYGMFAPLVYPKQPRRK